MKNKLAGHLVYEAGPMEDVQDNGVSWRKELTPKLHEMHIGVLDPCDKPCDFGLETIEERQITNKLRNSIATYNNISAKEALHSHCSDFVGTDLRLVDLASFVILYVDRDVHMCGSYVEAAHARLQRKPMLVVCKQGIAQIPGFIWGIGEHEMFFDNFDDCLDYLKQVNNGKVSSKSWKLFNFDKIFGDKIKWQ